MRAPARALQRLGAALDDLRHVDLFGRQRQVPRFDARVIQDVVDHAEEILRLALHALRDLARAIVKATCPPATTRTPRSAESGVAKLLRHAFSKNFACCFGAILDGAAPLAGRFAGLARGAQEEADDREGHFEDHADAAEERAEIRDLVAQRLDVAVRRDHPDDLAVVGLERRVPDEPPDADERQASRGRCARP